MEPSRLRDLLLLLEQRNAQNCKRRTLVSASQHKFGMPDLQGGAYSELAGETENIFQHSRVFVTHFATS